MRLFVGLVVVASACTTPPAPPAPREATAVNASAGRTWDAVIDAFAARNIPIRNMERASGFVSTDMLGTVRTDTAYADCGKAMGMVIPPARATYNVLVRGDSSRSTVRVTVRWMFGGNAAGLSSNASPITECSSKGVWETAFEQQVKARAESR